MDYSEKWGVDVEEAVKLALIDLKVSRDEVEVTVLEEPSKGFFGIGSKLAKVRVEKKKVEKNKEEKVKEEINKEEKSGGVDLKEKASYKHASDTDDVDNDEKSHTKPHSKENKNNRNKNRKNNKPADNKNDFVAGSVDIEIVNKDELTDVENHEALDFLKDVTDKMGLTLDFKAKTGEDIVYIEISGKDSGTVIGKRGQTLDAIQYLTSLVINKNSEKYIKVVIDAENYRAKRQKTLEQLANRLASKVIKTKKYVRLEPMNPYERKVIHATLQNNPRIVTRSEGEDPYRRVIIELKK